MKTLNITKSIFIILVVFWTATFSVAQVSINTDGTSPDSSAMLEIKSDNKGFLPPRLTSVDSIDNPVEGLMAYDYTCNCLKFYDGIKWSGCMGENRPCCPDSILAYGFYYKTATIGSQCWMIENYNRGYFIDGDQEQDNNGLSYKYCYDDDDTNCTKYGGLYEWDHLFAYSFSIPQGNCPDGWHIPSDDEFKTLELYLGMSASEVEIINFNRGTNEGSKLSGQDSLWISGSLVNDVEFGTSHLDFIPGGLKIAGGSFSSINFEGAYWTSTESNSTAAFIRTIMSNNTGVNRFIYSKGVSASVRCVRD